MTTNRPTDKQTRALGCEDCGEVFRSKSTVPSSCRAYTYWVERDAAARFGWTFTGDEAPF